MIPYLLLNLIEDLRHYIIGEYSDDEKQFLRSYWVMRFNALLHRDHFSNKYVHFNGRQLHYLDYNMFMNIMHEIFHDFCYEMPIESQAPVIVDFGSNIGLTIMYLSMRYPNARISGFEPDEDTFKCLNENITANNLQDRVKLYNFGLSDHDGDHEFYKDSHAPGSGSQNMYATVSSSEHMDTRSSIHLEKASRYITEHVDLIKIDVEGAELEILEDLAANDRLKLIDNMILEVHFVIRDSRTLARIIDIISDAKFEYRLISYAKTPFHKDLEYASTLMLYAFRP